MSAKRHSAQSFDVKLLSMIHNITRIESMSRKTKMLPFFFLSLFLSTQAQEKLSLVELIEIGLEANPSVQIMQNNSEIARNNHSYAPFMPSLRASGRTNVSRTNEERVLAIETGAEREFRNVRSENLGAGASLSWRIFDGLGMFATFDRTGLQYSVSELQTRRVVENLVVNISDQYYRIVVQEHRLEAARRLMELSRERFRIIQEQVNIGTASGMDLQQARLDFNADSSYLVRQEELLKNSYVRLNRLVNHDLSGSMYVTDTITLGTPLNHDDLELMAMENNSSVLISLMGIEISEADIRLARSGRFPNLDFVTGYTYNRSESPAGIATFNQSHGFNYGFEASMNIFNGFQVDRNIKNARILLKNQELTLEDTRLQVRSEMQILYNTYLNNLMMVDFEKQNVEVSRVNLDLALERYELGVLSGLGFREFQFSYINAVDRSLDALYQSKLLELSLLVLSGQMDEFLNRIQ
ncbi:outer membrane protein TolC [Natronoflexus pectinivorans]|uniref:Outer membrane protein TolC n=2 Tax=Natronoflexus pectinivorans TaxID=682526 RepID=A0A4R2GGQ5_9BACT|nr:outer membrane protein TolC [Natronoflexus pectinivorans]